MPKCVDMYDRIVKHILSEISEKIYPDLIKGPIYDPDSSVSIVTRQRAG
jgi:hypothetical protein